MEPNNTELKISMKMLNSAETASSRTPSTPPPEDPSTMIKIKQVINYLPYTCIVHLDYPDDIDWIYYAAQDSQGNKLFYKSEYPTKVLPSFTAAELNTEEKEFQFVCWPVKNDVVGSPSYYGPVPIHVPFYLGTYDLEVDFKKESDIKLFEQVKPILEKHTGKAAIPGRVSIKEAAHDVYLPSINVINLSADRRNIVHELVHANRKQALFANKKFKFDEETEMIEEFFAEGLSNMIKDELNRTIPNDYLPEGAVYGSTIGYNYDFRIKDPSLPTQNLQSSFGGILTLENSRYFLASEAFHKIALEYKIKQGKYFAKDFNRIYYDLVQETLEDPSKEMFFSICEQLIDTVELKPTRQWLEDQLLLNATIVPGEKIFMEITDYYASKEWIGIASINLYETFPNGSDWSDGNQRYNKNGETVTVELTNLASGDIVYNTVHTIADYPNGFGAIKLYFYYLDESPTLTHFTDQDAQYKIKSTPIQVKESGLYQIKLTSANATRIYYHLLGPCMQEDRGKLVISNPYQLCQSFSAQLIHYGRNGVKTILEPKEFTAQYGAFEAPFIKNTNCEPGILQIMVNSGGMQQNFQRNIGYGSRYGGHHFLVGQPPKEFLEPEPIRFTGQ